MINPNIPLPDLTAWLVQELAEVKKLLLDIRKNPEIASAWLPRAQVMHFFGYGDTQMAALEKAGHLTVAKVGNRKFVHRDSLLKLLQASVQV